MIPTTDRLAGGSTTTTEPSTGGAESSTKIVNLTGEKARGRVVAVDEKDFALVSQYRWHVDEKRRPNGTMSGPYARATIWRDGRSVAISMHKLITGYPKTDHANGDGLDNRRSNLRPATTAQNNHNQRPKKHSSRFKGVSWNKWAGKWHAEIRVNDRRISLGYFTVEEDAGAAYRNASLELQGTYAFDARHVPLAVVGAIQEARQAIALAMGTAEFERSVRVLVEKFKLLAHAQDSSQNGFPSWTIAGDQVVFRYLKRQRGIVTAAQKQWLDRLALAGADVDVWRPADLLSGRIAHDLESLAGIGQSQAGGAA